MCAMDGQGGCITSRRADAYERQRINGLAPSIQVTVSLILKTQGQSYD